MLGARELKRIQSRPDWILPPTLLLNRDLTDDTIC